MKNLIDINSVNRVRYLSNHNEMVYILRHGGSVRVAVRGIIYRWDSSGVAADGAIRHGGNHLHGTEFRAASSGSSGAWTAEVNVGSEDIPHVATKRLDYMRQNGYPDLMEAEALLRGENAFYRKNLQTTNQEGGRNNEWIDFA